MSNVLTLNWTEYLNDLWCKAEADGKIDFKDIEVAVGQLIDHPEYFASTIPAKRTFSNSNTDNPQTDRYILSSMESDCEEYFGVMANDRTISVYKGAETPTRMTIQQLPVFDIHGEKNFAAAHWDMIKVSRSDAKYEGIARFGMTGDKNKEWCSRNALIMDIRNDPTMSKIILGEFKVWREYLKG